MIRENSTKSNALLAAALEYLDKGFAVTCCCDPQHKHVTPKHKAECGMPGKVPIHTWKHFQDRLPTQNEVREWWKQCPEGNVGCVLGKASGLVRVDVDGKKGMELLIETSGGDIPPTWAFESSPGNLGLLFSWAKDLPCKTTSLQAEGNHAELRFMGNGSQTILPPSRHVSGSTYTWKQGRSPSDVDLAHAPLWLRERLHKDPSAKEFAEYFAHRCRDATRTNGGWKACCPAHDDTTPSLSITPVEDKVLVHCFAGCSPDEVVRAVGLQMQDLYRGKRTNPVVKFQIAPDGKPYRILANVKEALTKDTKWTGVFAYNTFGQNLVMRKCPPYPVGDFQEHAVTDEDDSNVNVWLQETHRLYCTTTMVSEAMQIVGKAAPYHPVQDYLNSLEWDREPRLETWLVRYAQATDSEYIRVIGPKILISAVARVMEPGCKVDTMTILLGKQGWEKSKLWNFLVGDLWFSDSLADLDSKDAMQDLQGKWIVEMSELAVWNRADFEHAKGFLSRKIDRFRPPYGRRSLDFPRQCIFVGSTNKDEIFRDDTGNRRYWPVVVTGWSDIEALTRDRDQLWAEAVYRYVCGEQWWLSREEEHLAEEQQAMHMEGDDWTEKIISWLGSETKTTTADILEMGLGIDKLHWTKANRTRIGAILRLNGWKYTTIRDGSEVCKGWVKEP